MTVVLLSSTAASAAVSAKPDPIWMTNGQIRVVFGYRGYVYVGGKFTQVRQRPVGQGGRWFAARNVARFNARTGRGDPSWHPRVNGGAGPVVYAIAASGKNIWIGGDFTSVNGKPRRNLAVIGSKGKVRSVAPQVGAPGGPGVRVLLSNGSRVFAGGYFTQVDGRTRNHLAAFDTRGRLVRSWRPSTDRRVFSMVFDCSRRSLFVGGQFRRAAGSGGPLRDRETVARFNARTGALGAWQIPPGTILPQQKAYDMAHDGRCAQLHVAYGKQNYASSFALQGANPGTRSGGR